MATEVAAQFYVGTIDDFEFACHRLVIGYTFGVGTTNDACKSVGKHNGTLLDNSIVADNIDYSSGCNDGNAGARDYTDRRFLYALPEVYYRRRCGRRREGVSGLAVTGHGVKRNPFGCANCRFPFAVLDNAGKSRYAYLEKCALKGEKEIE